MPSSPNRPTEIGRYKVLGELGGGGMGDVYRVEDPITRQELALKVLKFTYPRALHYFKREFRAVASLSHPNLVALYDLHFDKDQYFYTMELIEGCDLYVFVNGHNRVVTDVSMLYNPARLDRLRRVLVQLLRGLAFLHDHKRVHRDIKPSNILVDNKHRVRLVDFGIVKELMPAGEGQSLSQVFGTSTYFSPEQSKGSDVGPKADLYSVGVLLFELLSGKPPFTGASADVALKHRTEKPPALPQTSELSELCYALLRKDPADRPTAREALAMIRVDDTVKANSFEFIGRVHERRVLHETLTDVADGAGRVVIVEGQSGFGKTALLERFATSARLLGATVFSGTCVQRDHVPMRGIDTLVERLAEAYRRETAQIMRRFDLGERAALIDAFGFLGELLPEEEHGVDDGRSTPASGLHRWLSALASKNRVLLLVIEHLHLADESVCDVLENLLSGGSPPPVMLVFTVQTERLEHGGRLHDFLEFVYTRKQSRRIELSPFSQTETRHYLAVHMQPPPLWLAEYIQRETAGNPLLVSAMIDALKDDLDAEPPSLEQTIARQLDRLGDNAKAVVTALAVNGEPLTVATMQDATGLDAKTLYEALRSLSAEDVADLMTTGDEQAFIVGAHEPMMAVVRKQTEHIEQWHEKLALAHQKNRGPARSIRMHWRAIGLDSETENYARAEAKRARVDGKHPRAVEMIQLAIATTTETENLSDLWGDLVDSLARCGQHAQAAAAIGSLEEIDGDRAYSLRGRRCQFHLLAGQLAEYEIHAVDLPTGAHVPLASSLVDFLPDKARELTKGNREAWSQLVVVQLLAQSNTDGDYREAERILTWCAENISDEGPEWAGHFVLAEAAYLRAIGHANDAVDRLQAVLDEIKDKASLDTLLLARLRLSFGCALLDSGHIGTARREMGHLLRQARKQKLPSIRALASILQGRAVLSGGDERVANSFIEEAGKALPATPPSIPHARLSLVRIQQRLLMHDWQSAADMLHDVSVNEQLFAFADIRELRKERSTLALQAYLGQFLTDWTKTGAFNLVPGDGLLRLIASVRPRAIQGLTILSATTALVEDRSQDALDDLSSALNSGEIENGLVRARLLGLRSIIRYHLGRGGRKDWYTAIDILRGIDAAVPPELHTIENLWAEREDETGTST
ncbi:MAG: serine/threonine-protein kinase [Myxococcota bacterium]|nr:serine/threonine-protein kinase [Myxococcota bacterium]